MSLDNIIRRREIKDVLHEYMSTLFGAPGGWAQIANIIEADVCVELEHRFGTAMSYGDIVHGVRQAVPVCILRRIAKTDAEKTKYEKQRMDTSIGECSVCAKREKFKCLHPRDGFCAGFEPISEENEDD